MRYRPAAVTAAVAPSVLTFLSAIGESAATQPSQPTQVMTDPSAEPSLAETA